MTENVKPVLASTIMLLRDNDEGAMEVFMVARHHQIDFASGALVFPGGKAAKGDEDPAIRDRTRGAEGLSDRDMILGACAIRESFEECGVLLARKRGDENLVGPEFIKELDPWRPKLDSGEADLMEMLEAADLELALDQLVPFAHWVTPDMMPKRFDTMFYLVPAPKDQLAVHDGREAVDSSWVNPSKVLDEAKQGKWTIIFPTRMNIEKLARSPNTATAFQTARCDEIKTVTPWVEKREEGAILCIRDDAGYDQTEEKIERIMKS